MKLCFCTCTAIHAKKILMWHYSAEKGHKRVKRSGQERERATITLEHCEAKFDGHKFLFLLYRSLLIAGVLIRYNKTGNGHHPTQQISLPSWPVLLLLLQRISGTARSLLARKATTAMLSASRFLKNCEPSRAFEGHVADDSCGSVA